MKKTILYTLLIALLISVSSFTAYNVYAKKTYKVMVQMKNYHGEGAYLVVSVLKNDGKYIKSLQLIGDDKEWYDDLLEWWKFQKNIDMKEVDAISGETISGGERSTFTIHLDEKWINSNYKLRFETAVEEQKYHKDDLEIPLTTEGLNSKPEGKGYIRYVRILEVK